VDVKATCIRLSVDERRFARALSRRVPGCVRKDAGSVAWGLRWSLREQARKESIKLS
jgi:hypothetical protein